MALVIANPLGKYIIVHLYVHTVKECKKNYKNTINMSGTFCKGIKPFEENNEHQRFITRIESNRLMLAVHQSENIHLKYIVPILILSGCRRNEVLISAASCAGRLMG